MNEKKFEIPFEKEEEKRQLNLVAQCYEDKEAEINGRKYTFDKTKHTLRLKIFAFQSSIAQDMKVHNFEFLDTNKFREIEKLMFQYVFFEGQMLGTLKNHFEEYGEDYITLITIAMAVFTYPLHKGGRTS